MRRYVSIRKNKKTMLKKQDRYNIAVVGATGIVGESLLTILDSRCFPINNIHAVASQISKGV